MNIRQFEIFRAIMRSGSITAAANALGISQPAVSKVLAQAEDQLGCPLFDRIGGRLVPTMEAQLLFPDVDRVFRQMDALSALARDVSASRVGLLRIGASLPIAASILPMALRDFGTRHPEVKIHLHTLPKREIAEGLALGDIDVAVTLSAILAPSVRVEPLFNVAVAAVLPDDDPLCAHETLTPAMLVGRPLISYGSHAELGHALDAAFEAEGCLRSVAIQVSSSPAALPLVRAGLGIALVDGLALWHPAAGLQRRPFRPAVSTTVSVAVEEARPESRFLAAFRASLKRTLANADECAAPTR